MERFSFHCLCFIVVISFCDCFARSTFVESSKNRIELQFFKSHSNLTSNTFEVLIESDIDKKLGLEYFLKISKPINRIDLIEPLMNFQDCSSLSANLGNTRPAIYVSADETLKGASLANFCGGEYSNVLGVLLINPKKFSKLTSQKKQSLFFSSLCITSFADV